MQLRDQSLTQLRGMAQAFGVDDIFKMDADHLIQAIELKQEKMAPAPAINIPKPEYDARLMEKPPSKLSSQTDIEVLLQPYVARGLRLTFTEEQWFMAIGKKTDEGTLRMPLKIVLKCADRLMA